MGCTRGKLGAVALLVARDDIDPHEPDGDRRIPFPGASSDGNEGGGETTYRTGRCQSRRARQPP